MMLGAVGNVGAVSSMVESGCDGCDCACACACACACSSDSCCGGGGDDGGLGLRPRLVLRI